MSLYQRTPDGPYYMDFTVNNKRVFRSTGTRLLREAKRIEIEERQRIEESMFASPSVYQMTFNEALERIYQERWRFLKAGATPYNRLKKGVAPILGSMPLTAITEHHIELALQAIRDGGKQKSPKSLKAPITESTINRYKAYLKTLFTHARDAWKVLITVPYIKLHKEPKGRIRVYSREEEAKVLAYFEKHEPEMADLIMVLCDTGMRVGEVLALTYEDVQLDEKLIHVWVNKADLPRTVPMTARVHEILERRKTGMAKPFAADYFWYLRKWKAVRRAMGWKGGQEVLHSWRHTCGTRLYEATHDLYLVQRWLGHSDIKTTSRYAHLTPFELVAVANRLTESPDKVLI